MNEIRNDFGENGGGKRALIGGFLLGILSFLLLYGIQILDVTYDDWLLTGGDLSQHYLGWCFFRVSDWSFPVGLMDRISYPNQVSVIFTGSIPLFAVLFKLLRGLLPETFQYFGIWGLLCFGLQGGLGALLIRHFVKDDRYAAVGSLFFVLAPIELYRMYMHTALGAQWLLLAAFLLGLKQNRLKPVQRTAAYLFLGVLCGSIHLYFVPMCGIILGAFLAVDLILRRNFLQTVLMGMAYCFSAVAAVVLLGGLSHDHQLDAGGLGQFSFNLNGLINPQGWSRILPDLPLYGEGAGEGLAFPGTGILAALLAGALVLSFRKKSRQAVRRQISGRNVSACLVIAAVSIVISVSHRLALGGQVIWEIPYPQQLVSLWGMFRSSGRFTWPVVYLLILFGEVLLYRVLVCPEEAVGSDMRQSDPAQAGACGRDGKGLQNAALAVLAILLVFQIYDCWPQLKERNDRFSGREEYVSFMTDEVWGRLSEKEHLVFVSDLVSNQNLLYGLSVYALENDMTVNTFYFAHSAIKSEVKDTIESSLENPDPDTVYIYKEEDEKLCTDDRMTYRKADGLVIGILKSDS